MTPIIRRGQSIYLLLAAPIVVDCLFTILFTLAGRQPFQWYATLLWPLTVAVMVAALWQGQKTTMLLTGFFCAVSGFGLIAHGLQSSLTPGSFFGHLAGCPSAMVVALGLVYLLAGLGLPLLPSTRAFFAHQRARTEQAAAEYNAE